MPDGYANFLTGDILGPNLISTATDQYAAMYKRDGHVAVLKRPRAHFGWTQHTVAGADATAMGLPNTDEDGHRYPMILVDGLGYIHLWAEHHNDPMHYLVSTDPGDITAWDAPTIPGEDVHNTYPTGCTTPDGELMLLMRDGPFNSGSNMSDTSFWTRAAAGTVWSAKTKLFRGINIPFTGETFNGTDTVNNYSAYHTNLVVTPNGRIHIAWCWRQTADARSNFWPSYAYTDNLGATWKAVDGTTLTLPIDPVTPGTNLSCRTGITHPAGFTETEYTNWGGLAIDGDGYPHMAVSMYPWCHIYWDGADWQQDVIGDTETWSLHSRTLFSRMNIYWLNGELWVLVRVTNPQTHVRLIKLDGTASMPMSMDVGAPETARPWEANADPEALRLHGSVEVFSPDGNNPRVFQFGANARLN